MRVVIEVDVAGEGKEFEALIDQAVEEGKLKLIRAVYTSNPLSHCLIDCWTETTKLMNQYLEKKHGTSN